ncbi:hypothetical protein [Jannaschia rubra]|uniref:hypothetical protein n=1 Tax=Jannaschia rubra TaxID=282197 RepID=UPI0024939FE6|nr:hypothetical protein [Jannaschia rubra]
MFDLVQDVFDVCIEQGGSSQKLQYVGAYPGIQLQYAREKRRIQSVVHNLLTIMTA